MSKTGTEVNLSLDGEYKNWLRTLKQKVRSAQLKAAVQVNSTLLAFYWDLGEDIVRRQAQSRWGDGFLKQLSRDMMAEFPDIKGFSRRNLELVRQWYLFWNRSPNIAKQAVSQLIRIPWGHNLAISRKCQTGKEALYYVRNVIEQGWSRSVLAHQIESGLWQRDGQAVSNFAATLPAVQSDLAQQALKDPYEFDFLALTDRYSEKELEHKLTDHITQFLLELGAGFAYLGKQVKLEVGTRDFYIDLLFYHTRLYCHVVIELKTVDFEPEHAGKLNFYIKAVDEQLRQERDAPTIGLLLCRSKDKLVAEYSLSGMGQPMGVSEYELTQALPDDLQSQLPSIEDIEKGLEGGL